MTKRPALRAPARIIAMVLAVLLPVGAAPRPADKPPAAASQKPKPIVPEPLKAEEREELAARSEKPGPEVAGGALSNLHLTYIVIALAAAVIVLIAK